MWGGGGVGGGTYRVELVLVLGWGGGMVVGMAEALGLDQGVEVVVLLVGEEEVRLVGGGGDGVGLEAKDLLLLVLVRGPGLLLQEALEVAQLVVFLLFFVWRRHVACSLGCERSVVGERDAVGWGGWTREEAGGWGGSVDVW